MISVLRAAGSRPSLRWWLWRRRAQVSGVSSVAPLGGTRTVGLYVVSRRLASDPRIGGYLKATDWLVEWGLAWGGGALAERGGMSHRMILIAAPWWRCRSECCAPISWRRDNRGRPAKEAQAWPPSQGCGGSVRKKPTAADLVR